MKPSWILALTLSLSGGATSLSAGCGSSVGDPGSGGSAGTSGSNTGGNGAGDCTVDLPCPNKGVCIFPIGACHPGDKGTCSQAPLSCDGPPNGPVCNCDGKIVEGANAICSFLGAPSALPGTCQTGTFACGPSVKCTRNAEVCLVTSHMMVKSQTFECKDLTAVVGTCLNGIPDCSCVDLTSLGDPMASCAPDADHQETVSIVLP